MDIQNVPTLHKSGVLRQQCVLHIFEVVFCHLIVHLILERLQVAHEFALFVHTLQLFEQILLRLLSILPGPEEGKSHVFSRRSWVEDHHLNSWYVSLKLVFDG